MYYGNGKGKTALAMGQGIRAIAKGKRVGMIQFLDYYEFQEFQPLKSMEPNFRVFKFQKEKELPDETSGLKNEVAQALIFAKKILETGEYDLVILDGILDAVGRHALSEEEVLELLEKRSYDVDVVLTGTAHCSRIQAACSYVCHMETEKEA